MSANRNIIKNVIARINNFITEEEDRLFGKEGKISFWDKWTQKGRLEKKQRLTDIRDKLVKLSGTDEDVLQLEHLMAEIAIVANHKRYSKINAFINWSLGWVPWFLSGTYVNPYKNATTWKGWLKLEKEVFTDLAKIKDESSYPLASELHARREDKLSVSIKASDRTVWEALSRAYKATLNPSSRFIFIPGEEDKSDLPKISTYAQLRLHKPYIPKPVPSTLEESPIHAPRH